MKKVFFTLALVLSLVMTAAAQDNGLFGYGPQRGGTNDYSMNREGESLLGLPTQHGSTEDQSPLGTGTALLLGMGAAYLVSKKRREE